MRITFSPAAQTDLEEIGDAIASDNPSRAISFIQEIRQHCDAIVTAPRAAPERNDLAPGLRMLVHGNYLIFYRILDREIRIERVLHGARNILALLG
ncbi:MAG: type II toxin-antitoxin system RelE/ParE family toxin [Rhodospirillales bacterium]|nr:MAG: type II toxin-antitoxin system RelE/ParE family toxin [Rhodospirillales bacterium]